MRIISSKIMPQPRRSILSQQSPKGIKLRNIANQSTEEDREIALEMAELVVSPDTMLLKHKSEERQAVKCHSWQ